MKLHDWFLCTALFVSIGYILFLTQCREVPKETKYEKTTTTKTIIKKGDSIAYKVFVKLPIPVTSIQFDTVWMNEHVDTANILQKYFARYTYTDTITDDTSFMAIIHDIVTQNNIVSREYWAKNLRPQQIIYQTTEFTDKKWLFGLQANYYNGLGLGPSVIYIRKKDAIGGSIDLVNKGISVSYHLKFLDKWPFFSIANLKSRIVQYIKNNFLQLITGSLLQGILIDIVDSLKIDIRKVKLVTNSLETEVVFNPAFEQGSTWQLMGKPNCTNADGEVWCTITNQTIYGFILKTEIGANFECVAIKI